MLLDGNETADEAGSLKLPEEDAMVAESSPGAVAVEPEGGGEVRGRGARMED